MYFTKEINVLSAAVSYLKDFAEVYLCILK